MWKLWKYIFLGALGRGVFIILKEIGIVIPDYAYWIALVILLPIAVRWFYYDYIKKDTKLQSSQEDNENQGK